MFAAVETGMKDTALLHAAQFLVDLGARLVDIVHGEKDGVSFVQWRKIKINVKKREGAERETWDLKPEDIKMEVDFLLDGFLPQAAYDRLHKLAESVARPGMLAVEVGCFAGCTAFSVLPVVKTAGGFMYLLDWFRGCVDARHVWKMEAFPRNRVIGTLLDNMDIAEYADCAAVVVSDSARGAAAFGNASLDYLYIGADHRYAQFKADVDAWWPKLKPGGVVCGHGADRKIEKDGQDWERCLEFCEQDFHDGVHWGIARLLAERFPDAGYDAGIWWVYKGVL